MRRLFALFLVVLLMLEPVTVQAKIISGNVNKEYGIYLKRDKKTSIYTKSGTVYTRFRFPESGTYMLTFNNVRKYKKTTDNSKAAVNIGLWYDTYNGVFSSATMYDTVSASYGKTTSVNSKKHSIEFDSDIVRSGIISSPWIVRKIVVQGQAGDIVYIATTGKNVIVDCAIKKITDTDDVTKMPNLNAEYVATVTPEEIYASSELNVGISRVEVDGTGFIKFTAPVSGTYLFNASNVRGWSSSEASLRLVYKKMDMYGQTSNLFNAVKITSNSDENRIFINTGDSIYFKCTSSTKLYFDINISMVGY